MLGLRSEAVAFAAAVLTGMTVVCSYACIRRLRRVIPHSLAAVDLEDAGFWLGTAVFVFVQIYHTSNGSIRWYFAIGMLVGAGFFWSVERLFCRLGEKIRRRKRHKRKKV